MHQYALYSQPGGNPLKRVPTGRRCARVEQEAASAMDPLDWEAQCGHDGPRRLAEYWGSMERAEELVQARILIVVAIRTHGDPAPALAFANAPRLRCSNSRATAATWRRAAKPEDDRGCARVSGPMTFAPRLAVARPRIHIDEPPGAARRARLLVLWNRACRMGSILSAPRRRVEADLRDEAVHDRTAQPFGLRIYINQWRPTCRCPAIPGRSACCDSCRSCDNHPAQACTMRCRGAVPGPSLK